MPLAVNSVGWVKVPPPKVQRPSKPKDPLQVFRSPLAYITGRPEFKEPVKKPSPIEQYLLEVAPPPPIEPIYEERAPRSHRSHRSRGTPPEPEILATPVTAPSVKSRRSRRRHDPYEEADEEIPRPDLSPLDSQSQRSASPTASKRSGAAPSVRSRRDRPPTVYDDPVEIEAPRSSRSRRHVASSVYDDELRYERPPRRSYHREREEERYYSSPRHNYSTSHLAPAIQPIVIYSTPPTGMGGCTGHHHGCHGHQPQYQHQCYAMSQPALAPAPVQAAIEPPAPRPPPSEVSSRSSASSKSRPMSFKWYTATQPLNL